MSRAQRVGRRSLCVPVTRSLICIAACRHPASAATPVVTCSMDGLEALAKARATVASASASDGKEGEAAPASVLGVFIKVDCGYARAGARYDDAETVELVQAVVKSPLFKLTGLYSHSGNSYNVGAEEAKRIGQEEVTRVVDLATRLREAGIDVPVVSIGATPSVSQEVDWTGVTEVHPGNYCFLDRQQVACGSATLEQIAVFVLARVASRYPKRNGKCCAACAECARVWERALQATPHLGALLRQRRTSRPCARSLTCARTRTGRRIACAAATHTHVTRRGAARRRRRGAPQGRGRDRHVGSPARAPAPEHVQDQPGARRVP